MYSQSSQVMNRRRVTRIYGGGTTSVRGRQRGVPSQERVRLLQLTICLVLFLAIFLWKGVFPQKLGQVQEDLFALITTDLDFKRALAELGESLSRGDSVLSDVGTFCMEVFGPDRQNEPDKTENVTPIVPSPLPVSVLSGELRFLSQGTDAILCVAHYADLERYGFETVPLEDNPPVEPLSEEKPTEIPAVGTVIMVSDYNGDALPNNYTMDQLSLGELETVTPVIGHLNSGYGYRDHPINGRYQFHGGVDIGGQNGDPIGAFAAGTVEYIGEDDSYGQYLQIDHGNGVKSFYAHCSKILVSKGQTVVLGEKIAEIGSSGSATGPHLHLELKYNKMHLNPVYYVDVLEQ